MWLTRKRHKMLNSNGKGTEINPQFVAFRNVNRVETLWQIDTLEREGWGNWCFHCYNIAITFKHCGSISEQKTRRSTACNTFKSSPGGKCKYEDKYWNKIGNVFSVYIHSVEQTQSKTSRGVSFLFHKKALELSEKRWCCVILLFGKSMNH